MALSVVHSSEAARKALDGRTTAVVVIPVFNAYPDLVRCYEAAFRHTAAADCSFLVVDDASADRRVEQTLREAAEESDLEHDVVLLLHERNLGFVGTMNEAFNAACPRDVVILNSDVVVGPEWLTRLRAAAYEDTTTATATPLTNHGSIVSLPVRNVPTSALPEGVDADEAARRVALRSPRLRPRLPTGIGHCTYVKRLALDVLGGFDEVFAPGYGEEVDLSQRALASGLKHICADDVFVYHRGGSSFKPNPKVVELRAAHEDIVRARYPYYKEWVERCARDTSSTLATSLLQARRALRGSVVLVDGRSLGPTPMGTSVVTVETVRALAVHPEVRALHLLVPEIVPPYARSAFTGLDRLTLHGEESVNELAKEVDIVYRPFQVNQLRELEQLRLLGQRLVVSQLDLIAFHNPGYFADAVRWESYRDLTRLANATADGIAFISEHARADARTEGLLEQGQQTEVVYCGTDNFARAAAAPVRPALAERCEDGFVLVIGVSYKHKNRITAVRAWAQMRAQGWRGQLVLVGPSPPDGSSTDLEAEFFLKHPSLRSEVAVLADVSEAEKTWLYAHAGLVLYPTLVEGFGLVPFEAAAAGVACLASRQGSLDEVLPHGIPVIEDWAPERIAEQALDLLRDPQAAEQLRQALLERSAQYTWAGVAERLVALFDAVCARPRSRTLAVLTEDSAALALTSAPGRRLNGLLPTGYHVPFPEDFLQALRAVGERPALRSAVVSATTAVYRGVSRVKARREKDR